MSQVTVIAKVVAKNESVESAKSEMLKIIEPTRKEEGCIEYHLHQDNENPAVFVFYENWKNEDCLDKHMNTPHFKAFAAAIGAMTQDMSINKLTRLD